MWTQIGLHVHISLMSFDRCVQVCMCVFIVWCRYPGVHC